MADPDSDEEDTFVTIGTPLEVFEEDEVLKKPLAVHEQTVKDQQGRQRFHGAFTGGYSAGFYNTVGSLEGWAPSTFVSSRSKKAEKSNQRPEDFMDEEDLAEHGIAPKQISTTVTFTSSKKKKEPSTSSGSIIPGDLAAIRDLIIPARLTIGVKLLRGLGWKEGQGIGPRVKRKVKKKVKAPPAHKVYGCSLPPQGGHEDSSSSGDEYAEGLTFAPKDSNPISFRPKDDVHGIGYSGIDPSRALFGASVPTLYNEPAVTKGRKGISGTAFGVGALEEDDEDIYNRDSMANYDRELGGEDGRDDRFHGWTAPAERRKKKSRFGPPTAASLGHIQLVLEGFSLASSSLKPNKVYPPPRVPKTYRPVHHFKIADILSDQPASVATPGTKLDAASRAVMLGEVGSVFDLVSKSDKDKMQSAKEVPKITPEALQPEPEREKISIKFTSQKKTIPETTATEKTDSQQGTSQKSAPEPSQTSSHQPLFKGGMHGFKPFSKNPAKQERYEKFIELKKLGRKEDLASFQEKMTEWERTREVEEFERAALLYKPMSLLMASRFHTAKYEDDKKGPVDEPVKVLSDAEQAAKSKMYGKLTRESYEWHPDRVVCKRFNVPNPYPSSTIVGVPGTKREKFTVFDFLTIPNEPQPPPPPPPDVTLASVAAAQQKKTKKPGPLAILNTPSEPTKPAVTFTSLAKDQHEIPPQADEAGTDTASENISLPPQEEIQADSTTNRPPMDLFKAIFADSDSSDDESSPEKPDQEDIPVKIDYNPDSEEEPMIVQEEPSTTQSPPEIQNSISTTAPSLEPTIEKPEQKSPAVSSGKKDGGIFAMINKQIAKERAEFESKTVNTSEENSEVIGPQPLEGSETLGTDLEKPTQRPSITDGDVYGPGLPPNTAAITSRPDIQYQRDGHQNHSPNDERDRSDGGKRHKHKDRKKDSKSDRDRSPSRSRDRHHDRRDRNRRSSRDREEESRRKRSRSRSRGRDKKKDKHKDSRDSNSTDGSRSLEGRRNKEKSRSKSPVWVEAKPDKSKHKKKKSKHKKHKSKKSNKKKKTKEKESDSGNSADSESDSDDSDGDGPTNAHILQRLMMLKRP